MVLTKDDVDFIAKQTNLSRRKAKILVEEDRDLNLVLNQLIEKPISKDDITALSFQIIVKYIILKFSRDYDYDIAEKSYVSEIIIKHFPTIARSNILKSIPKDSEDINFAEYCLVLLGFFNHRLKSHQFKNYRDYLYYFRAVNPEFHSHLNGWMEIFTTMKTQEIFN